MKKRIFPIFFLLFFLMPFQPSSFSFTQSRIQLRPSALWNNPGILLVALGDSLTHGTRDATNNYLHTTNGYMQLVYERLNRIKGLKLRFYQPLWTVSGERIHPYLTPTNLGVDGSDIFTTEGLNYWKRIGASPGDSQMPPENVSNKTHYSLLENKWDKVLFPINLWAGHPVSQLDALIWHLNYHPGPAWVIFWIGSNDAALATLGSGGKNPEFLPIPFDHIQSYLKPGLRYLLNYGREQGVLSFKPYTSSNIERNLTTVEDFQAQYTHLMERLGQEVTNPYAIDFFLLTLPYYPEVGYLFDKSDLDFYCHRFGYMAPDFDGRVSFMTFGFIYALLKSGVSPVKLKSIFKDGLVISSEERKQIRGRIKRFNTIIKQAAQKPTQFYFHLLDIGAFLNKNIMKKNGAIIDGILFHRKWRKGNGFCLDGVHPSHTGHALIANKIMEEMTSTLNLEHNPYNLSGVQDTDPYKDEDGDGWLAGSDYAVSGLTQLLFLFRDISDNTWGDAIIDTYTPEELWAYISDIFLQEIIRIPQIKVEAERKGFWPIG